jgi:hypothetical protein
MVVVEEEKTTLTNSMSSCHIRQRRLRWTIGRLYIEICLLLLHHHHHHAQPGTAPLGNTATPTTEVDVLTADIRLDVSFVSRGGSGEEPQPVNQAFRVFSLPTERDENILVSGY